MVDTVEISKVKIKDTLSVDVSVWMIHPDDWEFRPSLSVSENQFTISDINTGKELASVDLASYGMISYGIISYSMTRYDTCFDMFRTCSQKVLRVKNIVSPKSFGGLWAMFWHHRRCLRKDLKLRKN